MDQRTPPDDTAMKHSDSTDEPPTDDRERRQETGRPDPGPADRPDARREPVDAADPAVPAEQQRKRIGSAGGGPYGSGVPGHDPHED